MKTSPRIGGLFALFLMTFLFAQPVSAQSTGWRHAQGGTITKSYFLYATLDENEQGNAPAHVYRCNRSGTSISGCKLIVNKSMGHANVLEHHWGSNYFWVVDNSGSWCFDLNGNSAANSKCGEKPPNKYPPSNGLTSQGRAIYGDYYLKAYGNTKNAKSRIAIMQKVNGSWKVIKNLDFSNKVYNEEIEDVAVDGSTGEVYYTMSGCFSESCWYNYDQEVRLYKYPGYKLPTADNNSVSKNKSGNNGNNSNNNSNNGSNNSKKDGSNSNSENSDEGKVKIDPEHEGQCATILSFWCDDAKSDGENTIIKIISFAVSMMTIGIVILATIGLIWCGYLIMTARDNSEQIAKAKKRIIEIVIGIILWALITLVIALLLPKTTHVDEALNGDVSSMQSDKEV